MRRMGAKYLGKKKNLTSRQDTKAQGTCEGTLLVPLTSKYDGMCSCIITFKLKAMIYYERKPIFLK